MIQILYEATLYFDGGVMAVPEILAGQNPLIFVHLWDQFLDPNIPDLWGYSFWF